MQYKEIMDIYSMNPIDCYENISLKPSEIIDDICKFILVTLYTIDEILRKNTKRNNNYYIENIDKMYPKLNAYF